MDAFDYTHYAYTVAAPTAATELRLAFRNVPGVFYLDNVSVTPAVQAVPEPMTMTLGVAAFGVALKRRRKA